MTARLDIVASVALGAEAHLRRLTNAEYLAVLKRSVWGRITAEQRARCERMLAGDRSRFVAVADPEPAYCPQLETLTLQCLDSLLESAPVPAERVRLVVTSQSAGAGVPVSSLVINRLGLSPSVLAIDTAFMGCAATVWGAELAARLLKPGELAVVLAAELNSAAAGLTASTVLGDGVGAFLLAKPPHRFQPRFRLHDFAGSHPCTDDALHRLRHEPHPLYYEPRIDEVLRNAVLPVVRRGERPWRQRLRSLFGRPAPRWQDGVDYFVLHTASRPALHRLKGQLGLTDRQVAHNFASFNEHGNTSSASVFYSLAELERIRDLHRGDRLLFLAHGGGLMTRCMSATVA